MKYTIRKECTCEGAEEYRKKITESQNDGMGMPAENYCWRNPEICPHADGHIRGVGGLYPVKGYDGNIFQTTANIIIGTVFIREGTFIDWQLANQINDNDSSSLVEIME